MIFKNYLDAYEGKTAWIFGKGPSLEMFKYLNIPKDDIRIAINEACNVVDVDFVFAHEKETLPLIWENACHFVLEYKFKNDIPEKESDYVVFYNKYQVGNDGVYDYLIGWDKQRMADSEMLIGITGTVHSAVHFCHYTGIKRIILVGFDYEAGEKLYDGFEKLAEYTFPKVYEDIYFTILKMAVFFGIEIRRMRYV